MVQRDYIANKIRPKKSSLSLSPKLIVIIATIAIVLVGTAVFFMTKSEHFDVTPTIETPKTKTQPPAEALPEQPQERWAYLKELEAPNSTSDNISTSDNNSTANTSSNSVTPKVTSNSSDSKLTDEQTRSVNTQTKADSSPTPKAESKPQATAKPKQTSKPATSANSKWVLQCGAFKNKSNADTIKANLAMVGVTSNVVSEKLYVVVVGPYDVKQDAEQTLESLKASGFNNCVIYTK